MHEKTYMHVANTFYYIFTNVQMQIEKYNRLYMFCLLILRSVSLILFYFFSTFYTKLQGQFSIIVALKEKIKDKDKERTGKFEYKSETSPLIFIESRCFTFVQKKFLIFRSTAQFQQMSRLQQMLAISLIHMTNEILLILNFEY